MQLCIAGHTRIALAYIAMDSWCYRTQHHDCASWCFRAHFCDPNVRCHLFGYEFVDQRVFCDPIDDLPDANIMVDVHRFWLTHAV